MPAAGSEAADAAATLVEPRFRGASVIPPQAVFDEARKNQPAWYRVLEQAYAQFAARPENAGTYADPAGSGATIEQIWLVFSLCGIETYCLLARPLPVPSTARITRLVSCSPSELVDVLEQIQTAIGSLGVTLAYHDGATGHCITLLAYDAGRGRFLYHDPWPARSLLAKENNAAGVDAQPEGTRWSVTRSELEQVAFAAFVFPHQWASVQKQDVDLFFEQWTKSEFFSFFHLRQVDERIEAGHTVRAFAPAAFGDRIALLVGCRESGKIVRAQLRIDTRWMIDNFALALDLAGSFVRCFAPAPDAAKYQEIADVLGSLRDPRHLLQARKVNPDESDAIRCVHALMGSLTRADVTTDLASLAIGSGQGAAPDRVLTYSLR